MSRQSLSRANQVYFGRVAFSPYQTGKPGIEVSMLYRYKPTGSRAITFTGTLSAGATTATLNANWGGNSGIYTITFSDGEQLQAILTNGATTCTFLPASFPQTGGSYGTTSGLINNVTASATVAATAPVVGVANCVAASQSINTGTPGLVNGSLATGGVATFDVTRNVVAAWTGTAVLTVTGTDMYGQTQTESSASGTSMTGKKTFATITAITVSANVTACTVGSGNVVGMPFFCVSGDFLGANFNDAADAGTFVVGDVTSPATATTGDVRGTYALAGTLNGAKFLAILLKPKDPSTQVGAFGVTPA